MRKATQLLFTLALAQALCPAARAGKPVVPAPPLDLQITVRVHNFANVSNAAWNQAQKIVTQIFRHAGVETLWIDGPADLPPGPQDLDLQILPRALTQARREDEVFGKAAASPETGFANFAMVFYDRVESLSWEMLESSGEGTFVGSTWNDRWSGLILGVAMAHELGHLLLGPNSHAIDGIMLAFWNRGSLLRAMGGNSRFTASQAMQLRHEVSERTLAGLGLRAKTSFSPELLNYDLSVLPRAGLD